MISVKHLSKTFMDPDGSRITVLKDVNCEIQQGEVISIIGPSGTGKSTFLRALNMLEPPTSGEIWFDGENIMAKGYRLDKLRQKMGMVFQSFNLFEHLTVVENIIYAPIHLLHVPEDAARKEAMELLAKVGLVQKADVYPASLSGGQKQRVAIARSLAMHPEVILFDEPTSALDPTMVGEVLSVMRQLAKDGLTMLIVTHEMRFARDVSTRIFFMNEGIIYEDGSPKQIFEHPVHSATKAFVNRIQKLVYEIESDKFDFLGIMSDFNNFCVKYNLGAKVAVISEVAEEMLFSQLKDVRPLTLRLTHTELSGETALDFMVEGRSTSPLPQGPAMDGIRAKVKQVVEEPTTRGFRVKILL